MVLKLAILLISLRSLYFWHQFPPHWFVWSSHVTKFCKGLITPVRLQDTSDLTLSLFKSYRDRRRAWWLISVDRETTREFLIYLEIFFRITLGISQVAHSPLVFVLPVKYCLRALPSFPPDVTLLLRASKLSLSVESVMRPRFGLRTHKPEKSEK